MVGGVGGDFRQTRTQPGRPTLGRLPTADLDKGLKGSTVTRCGVWNLRYTGTWLIIGMGCRTGWLTWT